MTTCRICGWEFQFLPRHLRHSHQITTADYRTQFDILGSEALADSSYRVMQAEKMRRMQLDGRITIPSSSGGYRSCPRGYTITA